MAKEKKGAMTPEERLAAALVLEAEQPHEVPDNWCWVKAGALIRLLRGVSYKKADAHAEMGANDCLIMRGGNIGEGCLNLDAENVYVNRSLVSKEQLIRKNDVVIVSSTGSPKVIGRAGISGEDYADVAFGAFLMVARPLLKDCAEYIDYFFQGRLYRDRIRTLASGVNINNIRADYITNMPVPLPPLSEQHRIRERIESLFGKLNEVETELRDVIEQSEARLATILSKALAGDYTESWRKEHGISIENWQMKTLEEITVRVFDGPFGSHLKTKDYIGSGVRVVRLENLRHLHFDDSKRSYVSEEKYEEIKAHTVLPTDIIMSTFISGNMKVCQLPGHVGFAANKADCIGIRPQQEICTKFLLYYLASNETFEYLSGLIHGSTRPRVNTRQIKSIPIALPSRVEQELIANILDEAFNKYQEAVNRTLCALRIIEHMKVTILDKAMRGELGTNDPLEANARGLLEEALLKD